MPNNSRFDTLAMMLEAAAQGSKKSYLMYKVNLSTAQNKKFMDYLLGRNLLSHKNLYYTTERGFEYLRRYRDLVRSLEPPSVLRDIIFNIEIEEDGTMGADIVHPGLEKQLIEQNRLNGADGDIAKVIPCG